MKKIFFLIICLLIVTSLFALDITFGGAIGFVGTFNNGSDWEDGLNEMNGTNSFLPGFELGAFWDIAINEYFSVQPEINYLLIRFGAKGNRDNSGYYEDLEYSYSMSMLEIPILAKFNLPIGKGKLSLLIGPSFQILLGNIHDLENIETNMPYSGGGSDHYIAPDSYVILGGIVAAGCQIPVSNGNLIFEFRYRRQLTTYIDNSNWKSNVFSLRVGYGFLL